jgi:precorrin-3B synthase
LLDFIMALVSENTLSTSIPPLESRRGACPTLARPMQTGDGLLARLRPVDNRMTLRELRALAEAAAQFGNGIIEITARGSLQIRGLRPETVAPFERAVLASGVDVAIGVGVETPPLAGLEPDELIDVRPIAAQLRERIAQHLPPLVLAPKLAITVDGGGRFHLGGVAADLKVSAFRDGERVAFRLQLGGGRYGSRAVAVVDLAQVIDAVISVLEKLSALGPTARGKDLHLPIIDAPSVYSDSSSLVGIYDLQDCDRGSSASAVPDISPSRGENSLGLNLANDQADDDAAGSRFPEVGASATSHSPPLRGRWPAGQRGVAKPETSILLGIAFSYCQATAASLMSLAEAGEAAGAGEIRLAPNHGLFITGLTLGHADAMRETAAALGFLTESNDPRRSISLCAGSRGCASAVFDTRHLAARVLNLAPDLLDGSIDLHLSGCAKGCAHPAAAPIAFVGALAGYGLVVNGAASSEAATYIAENDIDDALKRLQALVRQSKESGESTRACLGRLGAGVIAAALTLDGT